MRIVGVVTHSGAAQDVRRITSLARTIDVHERVNVTARILAGLAAVTGVRVLYLSEPTRLVERALASLAALPEATSSTPAPPPDRRAGEPRRRDARRPPWPMPGRCAWSPSGATAPTARSRPAGPTP